MRQMNIAKTSKVDGKWTTESIDRLLRAIFGEEEPDAQSGESRRRTEAGEDFR